MCAMIQVGLAVLVAAIVGPAIYKHVSTPVAIGIFAALTACVAIRAILDARSHSKP